MPACRIFLAFLVMALGCSSARAIDADLVLDVWPGDPPGRTRIEGDEHVLEGRPRPFYQITDVSRPQVLAFLPPSERATGAGVLVCPGGGMQRLAIEHEGLEVAEWLVERGVAAFVLKYRVPAQSSVAVQDAQRALSLVRSRADEWNVTGEEIGMVGFSAGGEIGAWMAARNGQRGYDAIDAVDEYSCRPAFAGLIYPGGLVGFRSGGLRNNLAAGLSDACPPVFLVHAFDDSSQNSLQFALALKQAGIPCELHLYASGGHGFGVRASGQAFAAWPEQFHRWLSAGGFLDSRAARDFAAEFEAALPGEGPLPKFSAAPQATMADAFAAQRRLVRAAGREQAGFKGGVITAAAQTSLGIDRPLTGVLYRDGWVDASDPVLVETDAGVDSVIETELGFLVAVDIGAKPLTAQQARDAVEAVVPIIEMPVSYAARLEGATPIDSIATNLGSDKFLVGARVAPADVDADSIAISLRRAGEPMHETNTSTIKDGVWGNLLTLMHEIVDQGRTIHAGDVIISGAIGEVHPAAPGDYHALYDGLGEIRFRIE